MDIVLFSREEKTAIIIENKIWSDESDGQLQKYYKVSLKEYQDCRRYYVYLTPEGTLSSDPEKWISFSYEEIVDSLESVLMDVTISPEVELLIKHYIETVRNYIMNERDDELVRICNEIYAKHRKALRLIFQNVDIDNSIESEVITATLQELCEQGKILYDPKNRFTFSTQSMDSFLPPLDTPDSSWGTNYIYAYWLEKTSDDRLKIHLELAGKNLNEEQRKHSELLIQAKNKCIKPGYQFCRLYYAYKQLKQDDYEDSLHDAVVDLVNKALKFEEELLCKAQKIENK